MTTLLDQYGKPFKPSKPSRVRATYDAAGYGEDNARHWANASTASANVENDKDTRTRLRDRSRYEVNNNSYACGLLETVTNDIIGTGPRLQISVPNIARSVTTQIERAWAQWVEQIELADLLRVGAKTKMRDGEVFGLYGSNPHLDPFLPQLSLRLYEADQVTTPYVAASLWDPHYTDGIVRDDFGNITTYHFLKNHPHGEFAWLNLNEIDHIPAERVAHWYRPNRPGQSRGIPEITAALPLFAMLRRYTLATLTAAEFAASISGVLETETGATYAAEGEEEQVEIRDRFALERNTLLTLPAKWRANQMKAEQPVTQYGDFITRILGEIGRCLGVPLNVILGSSAGYNYSSGRLDHLCYHRIIKVERDRCRVRVLDPLFRRWLNEAVVIKGLLPAGLPPFSQWGWQWYWDGFESIDSSKDATARQIELSTNQMSWREHFAEFGQDWREEFEQMAEERRLMTELGITPQIVPVVTEEEPANAP